MYRRQLDGLRAILFFAVFSYHHSVGYWFLTYALPCFFGLSGFLITRLLMAGDGLPRGAFLKSFYARRALRILPLFYLFLALTLCFGLLRYPVWHAIYAFNIKLYLASIDPHHGEFLRVFADWQHGQLHLWSLAVEEQFYLIWPFFIVFCPRRLRVPIVVILIAGSIWFRLWFANHPTYSQSLYGALLPICGEYILWGSLIGMLEIKQVRLGAPSAWLYGGTLGLIILAQLDTPDMYHGFFQFIPSARQTWFALAITAFIYGLWTAEDALLTRFMRFPPLAWLGKMSYGLYVVHMTTWDLGDWLAKRSQVIAAIDPYFLRLGLCILIASASWYLFELPINRLKRRFPTPRPA
ncbi:MAG: acyltransferase [Planctomycetes bacterium]|nr:acyltransferase [Planctomycetota bacterium]